MSKINKKIKEVMSYMGSRNTDKQQEARRGNIRKAIAKRWDKKVVDNNSHL